MRIEVAYRSSAPDGRARRLLPQIRGLVPLVESVRLIDVYLLEIEPALPDELAAELFADPVAQELFIDKAATGEASAVAYRIEISSKPGVTDPVAATARKAIESALDRPLPAGSFIQTAQQYAITTAAGKAALSLSEIRRITALLHNPLIQQATLLSGADWAEGKRFPPVYRHGVAPSPAEIERFELATMDDESLAALSKGRLLALDAREMAAVKAYFGRDTVQAERQAAGLDARATDVELEMIAQTWSEHCKHKIFNAVIRYREGERRETIRSLFATYIKKTTEELAPRKPFLRSVFHDNSGVVEFDAEHLICFKVETHNSPSALDPYGGSITGIVGVNRDILGTGKGAKPIFNTDVLCFGYPDTPETEVAAGLLHPARVLAGVHRGIVDGGNQSGIPVVGGAFLFDESFMGKPLVFCGTGGLLPASVLGEPGWSKRVEPGDLAVMVGGRIGKDGIHGATFSSQVLDEASPTSAVQIGDPIVQRKMSDFLLEARDLGLYKGITDNGAGGLSSSLGEMAQLSNGVRIELDLCPLKYAGLAPWEILVSESQERMSLAVSPDKIEGLLALAARRDVEATVVGCFTDSGRIEVLYEGRIVGLLSLEFLHDGLPVMELEAEWPTAEDFPGAPRGTGIAPRPVEFATTLLKLLADPSIASKEPLIRQYDHEVIGQSVVKPFIGERSDGPSDGAVIRPLPASKRGITITHGICPSYSPIDTYHMAMVAVDEAFRAHIALGGNPELASALDNFCWPDPVRSEQTPDGAYKLAQLVRACRGLRDACLAYGLPLISGKDSMKNDANLGGKKVSIKPTLLVSLMGIIDDIERAVTSDFKGPDEVVYLLGESRGELAGSAYERAVAQGGRWRECPRLFPEQALPLYRALHKAISAGLVSSCHDLADGGLAVALAESALAGRLGARVELDPCQLEAPSATPATTLEEQLLFGESPSRFLVSVGNARAPAFEAFLHGQPFARIGAVTREERIVVRRGGAGLVDLSLDEIERAWKAPFGAR